MNDVVEHILIGIMLVVTVVIGAAIVVVAVAGIAWLIGYVFEHWLTWCEVDPVMLRTLIVAMGFVIPFMVVRPSHSD